MAVTIAVCCEQALELFRDLSDRYSESFVWDSLGYLHQRLRHESMSITHYQRAVSLFRDAGNRVELAETLARLGDACRAAGRAAAAREAWREAVEIFDDLGHAEAAQVRAKLRGYQHGPVVTKRTDLASPRIGSTAR